MAYKCRYCSYVYISHSEWKLDRVRPLGFHGRGGWWMAFLRNGHRQPGESLRYDHRGGLAGGCAAVGFGESGRGTVFKIGPNGSGWTESALWTFTGGSDGSYPYGPMVMDTQGHLYGAASYGVGLNSTNPACAPKRQPSRLRYRLQAHAITTDKRAMPGSKARHRFLPNGRRALRNSSVSSMRILLHALRTYFVVHSAC
jgi:hypothetical protein